MSVLMRTNLLCLFCVPKDALFLCGTCKSRDSSLMFISDLVLSSELWTVCFEHWEMLLAVIVWMFGFFCSCLTSPRPCCSSRYKKRETELWVFKAEIFIEAVFYLKIAFVPEKIRRTTSESVTRF